jgi:hypothetical protein
MAVFASVPKVQFFDVNGDPLSGGKVYTYEVGTTTNKASYPTLADAAAETNANANPVILDSRGEAVICLTGPTKFTIDDSADSNIYTVDNYYTSTNGVVYDSNNNEILELTATASAVNNIEVKNNSTGVNAEINSSGEATRGITLRDSNGQELVTLTSVASAVNFIDIDNGATGEGCTITCSGGDDNVGFFIQPKGTGVVGILGTATSSAEVRLYEDTDNGTNYLGFKAPAALTASTTFTWPDGDGAGSQVLQTDGAGTLSWVAN